MRIWLLAAAIALAACGGDDGPSAPDARPIDAAVPDAEPDPCVQLCGCLADYCGDTSAACMTECQALDDSVRACRIEHCGYAQTNPSYHCPHAFGDPNGQKTPVACLQPE